MNRKKAHKTMNGMTEEIKLKLFDRHDHLHTPLRHTVRPEDFDLQKLHLRRAPGVPWYSVRVLGVLCGTCAVPRSNQHACGLAWSLRSLFPTTTTGLHCPPTPSSVLTSLPFPTPSSSSSLPAYLSADGRFWPSPILLAPEVGAERTT